jgi:hypothetical protein
VPLKAWVKNALDHVIRECMNEPGLEFVWVGDDAIDPLEQAQTLQILAAPGSRRARRRGRTWAWGRRAGRGRRLSLRGRWSPSAGLRARHWGSSTRIMTSGGNSRRPTERSPQRSAQAAADARPGREQ